jgi:hypothetical protein
LQAQGVFFLDSFIPFHFSNNRPINNNLQIESGFSFHGMALKFVATVKCRGDFQARAVPGANVNSVPEVNSRRRSMPPLKKRASSRLLGRLLIHGCELK